MPNQLKSAQPRKQAAGGLRGTLRGEVTFEGCPIPHDIVRIEPDSRAWRGSDPFAGQKPHPGKSFREFLTPTGIFAAHDLEPGNYVVSARFQFGSSSLLPTKPVACRVTVTAGGEMALYDPEGRPLPESSKLTLVVAPEIPEKGKAMGCFRGVVTFIGPPPEDLKEVPLFIAARDIRGRSTWLAAIEGGGQKAQANFVLPVEAGCQYILQLQSAYWAPVSSLPQTEEIEVGHEPVDMAISVVRAGAVHGQVTLPDGRPYEPAFPGGGEACSGEHYLDIQLMPDAMCFDRMINPDGTFDLVGVPPGIYVGEIFPRGASFQWLPGGLEGVRVEAGKTTQVGVGLRKGAEVRMEPAACPLRPPQYEGVRGVGAYAGRERWVRAMKAGVPLGRDEALRLFVRELHGRFQFKQDAKGAWYAPQAGSPGATVAEPGLYDLYLLETSVGWGPPHYLRVLAKSPECEVAAKRNNHISFKESPLCWGQSRVTGVVAGVPPLSAQRGAGFGGDILRFLGDRPTLTLRGERHGLAAVAWAQPSKLRNDLGFGVLLEALATGRYESLIELLRTSEYAYEIPDIPGGEFELEIWAPGCAAVRQVVRLDDQTALKLNLRLHPEKSGA